MELSTKLKLALSVAPGVIASFGMIHAGTLDIAGITDALHRGVLAVIGGYGD